MNTAHSQIEGEMFCDVCNKITIHIFDSYEATVNRGRRSERKLPISQPLNCKECGL